MKLLFRIFFLGLLATFNYSCSKRVEARKPITIATSSTFEQSIENNKKRYAAEEQAIETIIKNLEQEFDRSADGFYYKFVKKDSIAGKQPTFGDRVTFEYDVVALNGDTIYKKDELSPITKSLDQEYGVFKGMRAALKLMNTNEEMIVYFPSYSAYGYYGDNNRIGANVPFKSKIKILGINIEE